MGALALVLPSVDGFLSVTEPVTADVLVVEGWMPDYAMPGVIAEFNHGSYRALVASAHSLPDWWVDERYQTLAEVTVATLACMGLATNRMVIVPPSRRVERDRTYSSAVAFKQWLDETGIAIRAVNIFSLGPHSRRTRLLFEKALGPKIRVGIISHPPDKYDSRQWWRNIDGFTDVVSEGVAYLYARLLFHPH